MPDNRVLGRGQPSETGCVSAIPMPRGDMRPTLAGGLFWLSAEVRRSVRTACTDILLKLPYGESALHPERMRVSGWLPGLRRLGRAAVRSRRPACLDPGSPQRWRLWFNNTKDCRDSLHAQDCQLLRCLPILHKRPSTSPLSRAAHEKAANCATSSMVTRDNP